jgi:dUTP pyrophosphatase
MTVLNGTTIKKLCLFGEPKLVENYIDIEVQVQQNGIDLTVATISKFDMPECETPLAVIDFDNSKRQLCNIHKHPFNFEGEKHGGGMWRLPQGVYIIQFNEIVNIPNWLCARANPRSTLMRCGCTTSTAVWDAGYSGKSSAMLSVFNPNGITLHENARVMQLVFETLNERVEKGYNGIYQNEGVRNGN